MTVHFELADHVARVTLDRPQVLNAIDFATEAELQRIWIEIERDDRVRCVVLTGAGEKAFCVGSDVSAVADSGKVGVDYWLTPRPGGFGGIAHRPSLTVPVVGRINGYALGGGFEMVLGCDLAIAADTAQFGLTEPRIGFLPIDGGMVLLHRQIPRKLAMSILLTGRRLKADEALRFGLINEVVAAAELDAAVDRWVDQILACAPLCTKAIKQVASHTPHLAAGDALALRLPAVIAALESEDKLEGVAAFREKRRPNWQGR